MRVNNTPTFIATSALAANLRVKLTAGKLVVAGDDDDEVGTLDAPSLAADAKVAVIPREDPCVRKMVASEAISIYDEVYAADDGKVATTGTLIRGIAMEAASGDGSIINVLTLMGSLTGTVARANLVQDELAPYAIPNEAWYLFDSTIHAPLGATALSSDDLIYTVGTLGTTAPTITGTDFGATTASQKARTRFTLPPEYVAGQTITLRCSAFTGTTVASVSSTIDFSAYRQAAPTVDIVATAATSVNALTASNKDFTLTPTNCVAGDVLDILMTYAGEDGDNLGVIVPTIVGVTMLLDIKG